MATYTTNYNLKKPAYTDIVDVADFNGNSDTIDATLNTINTGLGNKATKPTNEATATDGYVLTANGDGTATFKVSSANVTESCIVTVSTEDSQSVVGQTITITDKSVSSESQTYTLLTGENAHTFKVTVGHVYTVKVNAKSGYSAPSESAEYTAIAGNTRNVAMQYFVIKRYGFRRNKNDSNPATRIEYLNDAVGITPAYMNFSTGNFDYGGWSTFCQEVNRLVMLKADGTVDYELSRTDQTKKADGVTASDISNTSYNGNAMSEFRKYKWVHRSEDAGYEYIIFSKEQYNETYKAYAHTNANGNIQNEFYWGMFKGSNVANKLRSIADQAVMVSQTRNTEVSYAQANGAGHYTIYKSGWEFIGDLITLISKSDHSQDRFGTGRNGSYSALATGTLKALPMFKGYTDNTSDVKVFGIEGFWGNVWEGMAGLVYNGAIKTKMTPPYNFDGTGYTNTGIVPSGTSGGYINTASVTDVSGWVPKTAMGSATTYYCDGLWYNNSQVDYAIVGGDWSSGLLDGSRYVALSDLASRTATALGSRLSYLNPA
jgi:hypothetical protein